MKLASTLALAAVLLAVLVLPRLGQVVGPAAQASFDPAAAMAASADQAGLMRSGGIWAVAGPYLLTSTDNGASWRAGDIPAGASPVFVLDPDHAWTITSSSGSSYAENSNVSPTVWNLVVVRTSDGGGTWLQTTVSGDFSCGTATFSFVDADHGFLMCANFPGPTASTKGSGTLLRTVDGGATWQVMSHADGLGSMFTASDANTLWSAEDYESSSLDGVALHVSRDAGATWSTVDLPGLASLPIGPIPGSAAAGEQVGVGGGPTFVDASHGAFAVLILPVGSTDQPTVWFYRTSDAGRSWTLVKKPTRIGNVYSPIAMVGREWAIIGTNAVTGLTVSGDSGASWTDVPGYGLPDDSQVANVFDWVDFTDRDHAAAVVSYGYGDSIPGALMLSSDGGRTWSPADFGDARAKVPAYPVLDPGTARGTVELFEMLARRDPQSQYAATDTQLAWRMLSPYSQRSFGSESAFEAAEGALTTTRIHLFGWSSWLERVPIDREGR